MRNLMLSVVAMAGLLAWTGCGDPLIDGGYRGEPMVQLKGNVFGETEEALTASGTMRVALFWVTEISESIEDLAEGEDFVAEQGAVVRSALPARYTISIFNPPPANLAKDPDAEALVALVLLYGDANENGRWDRDTEPMLGGADRHLVVFTPRGTDIFDDEYLEPGYHVMFVEEDAFCEEEDEFLDIEPVSTDEDEIDLKITDGIEDLLPDIDCDDREDDWEDDDDDDDDDDDEFDDENNDLPEEDVEE